jgi:hypothetical protein
MLKNIQDLNDAKEILLALLSNSGTLAGISIALVGIINLKPVMTGINRFADDLFMFSALGFVLVCYLVFFAFRQLHSSQLMVWSKFIDIVFLASLTLLVLAGFFNGV